MLAERKNYSNISGNCFIDISHSSIIPLSDVHILEFYLEAFQIEYDNERTVILKQTISPNKRTLDWPRKRKWKKIPDLIPSKLIVMSLSHHIKMQAWPPPVFWSELTDWEYVVCTLSLILLKMW